MGLSRLNKLGTWKKADGNLRYGVLGLLLVSMIAITATYFFMRNSAKLARVVPLFGLGSQAKSALALPQLVASYRDVPPDMLTYSPGRHSGPLRYVLEEAANKIGYTVEWKQLSFSRSATEMADGSIDVIPYVHHKTPSRESLFRFSVSLGEETLPIYFVKKKDNLSEICSMKDLTGHHIGFLSGRYYFAAFHASTQFKKIAYPDDKALISAFSRGEVDLIASNNKMATERALKTIGLADWKYTLFKYMDKPNLYFLYSPSPKHTEMFNRLDKALLELRNEGSITDIYQAFNVSAPK